MMTDGTTGAPVAFHDYLAFGEEIQAGIGGRSALYDLADPKQKFTGKERDAETGLDNFEVRYFGSPQGRFTSADEPLTYADPGDPQTWNLYSYASSSPLTFADDGHMIRCANGVDQTTKACKPNPADMIEMYFALHKAAVKPLQDAALGALQSVYQYLSLPRDMGCMAARIGVGLTAGFMVGAGSGGLAGGGTALVTTPVSVVGGGVAGYASGMNSCIQGSGWGGGGTAARPKGVPDNWREVATKNGGTKWVNPNNPHDYVRVRTDGTITQVRNGKSFDVNGNLVDFNSSAAHGIAAGQFVFRP
jgi:RHS repeat-associated protein